MCSIIVGPISPNADLSGVKMLGFGMVNFWGGEHFKSVFFFPLCTLQYPLGNHSESIIPLWICVGHLRFANYLVPLVPCRNGLRA